MWLIKFLKSNVLYLLWFVIYFTIAWWIFGATLQAFIIVAAIYGISMSVALSPVGEIILIMVENCREPVTERERKYLIPIFEEAYQNAKEFNKSLNNGIKIYIMDAMYVNAFAIGRKTVAVTRGALSTFTAEELKGIIAHELGHMTYGHTKALLLTMIGNVLFSAIAFVLRLILYICEIVANITARMNIIGIVFMAMTFVARIVSEFCIFFTVTSGQFLLALNSRINEQQADKFAYDIGLGKQLISGLYTIQKISIHKKLKLSEMFTASHPHIADRIAWLERLENGRYT